MGEGEGEGAVEGYSEGTSEGEGASEEGESMISSSSPQATSPMAENTNPMRTLRLGEPWSHNSRQF